MPGDNAVTVAVNSAVEFPQDGPALGSSIVRTGPSTFNLVNIGTYSVLSQVSVNEAGNLQVALGGIGLGYTVVGRATGTSQIVIMTFVRTTVVNEILSIINAGSNGTALTVTPFAGDIGKPVSATLAITRLS
jgi:hypothetical protein